MASFLFFFVHHIGEVNKGPRGMDHEPEGISVGVQGNEIRLTGQVFDVIGDPYSNLLCPLTPISPILHLSLSFILPSYYRHKSQRLLIRFHHDCYFSEICLTFFLVWGWMGKGGRLRDY